MQTRISKVKIGTWFRWQDTDHMVVSRTRMTTTTVDMFGTPYQWVNKAHTTVWVYEF